MLTRGSILDSHRFSNSIWNKKAVQHNNDDGDVFMHAKYAEHGMGVYVIKFCHKGRGSVLDRGIVDKTKKNIATI